MTAMHLAILAGNRKWFQVLRFVGSVRPGCDPRAQKISQQFYQFAIWGGAFAESILLSGVMGRSAVLPDAGDAQVAVPLADDPASVGHLTAQGLQLERAHLGARRRL